MLNLITQTSYILEVGVAKFQRINTRIKHLDSANCVFNFGSTVETRLSNAFFWAPRINSLQLYVSVWLFDYCTKHDQIYKSFFDLKDSRVKMCLLLNCDSVITTASHLHTPIQILIYICTTPHWSQVISSRQLSTVSTRYLGSQSTLINKYEHN